MKNLIATLGAVFVISTASAQSAALTMPDEPRPAKNTHGQTVSTAAQQTYEQSEKGKFVRLVARLKSQTPHTKKVAKAKGLDKAKPENKKMETVTNTTRPGQTRRVMVQKTTPNNRSERVNRVNPVRRPAGNGRFSQVGRG